jgi:hypothetical protein
MPLAKVLRATVPPSAAYSPVCSVMVRISPRKLLGVNHLIDDQRFDQARTRQHTAARFKCVAAHRLGECESVGA